MTVMTETPVAVDRCTKFRIAVLIVLYSVFEESAYEYTTILDHIRNEIWCLRNGYDTSEITEITFSAVETDALVRLILNDLDQRERRAALLVCTLKHIQ